jgi:hypothetical protein
VGRIEGREGGFSRDGGCGKLFRGGLLLGSGGRAAVGGSAAGRESTGEDMLSFLRSWCWLGSLMHVSLGMDSGQARSSLALRRAHQALQVDDSKSRLLNGCNVSF